MKVGGLCGNSRKGKYGAVARPYHEPHSNLGNSHCSSKIYIYKVGAPYMSSVKHKINEYDVESYTKCAL